mmetsp:Transcript_66491/g.187296  ORF Transcript_66491/g.187296 Transcript_66491/m.187296 type:complete len:463 (+) Transcript_66491:75-1463(+)
MSSDGSESVLLADHPLDSQGVKPSGRCAHAYQLRHIICALVLACLQGTVAPAAPYIVNTFFAATHGGGDCEAAPDSDACRQGAADAAFFRGCSSAVADNIGMLTAVNLGSCSDSIGRRPLIRVNGVLRAMPYIALAGHMVAGLTLWVYLVLGAAVEGFDVNGVFGALLHDAIPNPDDKAAAFGVFFVVMGLVGAIVLPIGFIMPPLWALAVTLVAIVLKLLYLFFAFPETAPASAQDRSSFLEVAHVTFRVLTRNNFIFRMSAILALSALGGSGYAILGPLYMNGYVGVKRSDTLVLALVAGVSVLAMFAVALGPLVARVGEVRVLQISMVASTVFPLLWPACTEVWHLCVLFGLFTGPLVLSVPVVISIKGKLVAEDELGLVQGAMASISKLMATLGLAFFGWLAGYATDGGRVKSTGAFYMPMSFVAGFNLAALLLSTSLPTSLPPPPTRAAMKEGGEGL